MTSPLRLPECIACGGTCTEKREGLCNRCFDAQIKFPKMTPPRLKGAKMKAFRLRIFIRDGGRCKVCRQKVSFDGKDPVFPPMHLSHKRNKRMHGDTPENCETLCPTCHLVGKHNPKSVPPKGTHAPSIGSN